MALEIRYRIPRNRISRTDPQRNLGIQRQKSDFCTGALAILVRTFLWGSKAAPQKCHCPKDHELIKNPEIIFESVAAPRSQK